MEFEVFLTLPEGPPRTAALAAWVQSLYDAPESIPVLTIRPEDLLADRLRSLVYWKHREDGFNAFLLAWTQRKVLDQGRMRMLAPEDEMRAALDGLLAMVTPQGRKPSSRRIQRWISEVVP